MRGLIQQSGRRRPDQVNRREPSASWRLALQLGVVFIVTLFILWTSTASAKGQGQSPIGDGGNRAAFCTVCHSNTQVELKESVHSREGITCIDCHGGNPSGRTVEAAHSGSFRRAMDHKQVVELCSGCHSDQARMKPYGIPTDQHALYMTSVHGKRFLEGDTRVAICTDCHGAHGVLSASDPKSPVYLQNIPETCGRCHASSELMKAYNLPANVVSEYKQGIHGRALLELHNRQAPDCTRCHGAHGAAPPGIGDVARVCGQCHTRTLEAFRQSAHESGGAGCISCHNNHRIEQPGHQMWATACSNCHQSDSPPVERGQKIQAFFVQAEAELEKAKQSVEQARRIPLDVSDYEARLSESLTYLVEARPASHNLRLEEAEDLTRRSRSISLEVQSDIHGKLGVFRGRIIVLALVWFYILISVAVLYRYRRELERRRRVESS